MEYESDHLAPRCMQYEEILVVGAVSLLPIMTRAEYREWLLGQVEVGRDSMCVIWLKLISKEHFFPKGKERL